MDQFNNDDLQQLLAARGERCVSIYLPTDPARAQHKADATRLENLVRQAERWLVAQGMRPAGARDLLAPARDLGQDPAFWQSQGHGLALFLGEGPLRHYRLPLPFEELLTVAGRFTVRPLLPLLSDDATFYILALTQHDVRLIRSTRWHAEETPLPPHAASVAEATGFDSPQRGFAYHGTQRGGGSGRHAVHVHAVGTRPDDSKKDLVEYCQALDRAVHAVLGNARDPLVLAGVDPLLSTWRKAVTRPGLLEASLPGATERLSADDLRARAWPLVEAELWKARQPLIDRYRQSMGTGTATNDLAAAVRAAASGRVATLFVDATRRVWGRYVADEDLIEERQQPQAGDLDLLDEACVHTLAHGGKVFSLPAGRMPDGSVIAALFHR